jgi:hypothetical protein
MDMQTSTLASKELVDICSIAIDGTSVFVGLPFHRPRRSQLVYILSNGMTLVVVNCLELTMNCLLH